MAEQKRYYWLKFKDDFFDSKRIKKLRNLGADYVIIYLKMQLKALKTNGYLYFTGIEESIAGEIALDIDEDTDKVQLTLSYLQASGLIETQDNGDIFLPYVEELTCSETAVAQRVREHRERKQSLSNTVDLLHCNTNVTPMKQNCNVEKDIEIEKEKDKEIDIDTPPISPSRGKRETPIEMFDRLTLGRNISGPLKDKLHEWIEYKQERRESYKERGLKAFITWIESQEQIYGSSALIECITLSMAKGYKGIITDLIDKKPERHSESVLERIARA